MSAPCRTGGARPRPATAGGQTGGTPWRGRRRHFQPGADVTSVAGAATQAQPARRTVRDTECRGGRSPGRKQLPTLPGPVSRPGGLHVLMSCRTVRAVSTSGIRSGAVMPPDLPASLAAGMSRRQTSPPEPQQMAVGACSALQPPVRTLRRNEGCKKETEDTSRLAAVEVRVPVVVKSSTEAGERRTRRTVLLSAARPSAGAAHVEVLGAGDATGDPRIKISPARYSISPSSLPCCALLKMSGGISRCREAVAGAGRIVVGRRWASR